MSPSEDLKQCYKCVQLLDNLNIELNASNSMILMWNKYQIIIYEDFKFKSAAKVFTPEYQVHRLLITNDYFLCLDTNGFVHNTTLNFKNPEKIFRSIYHPRGQDIKACVIYNRDESLSLKFDSGTYYLCLNKIKSDFQEVKKVALRTREPWMLQDGPRDDYFLVHRQMDEYSCGLFQKIFNTEKLSINLHFTVISFDKHTLYGCLFDQNKKVDVIDLVKLYACPSEISSIELVGTDSTYMLIGLKMGTVLRLTLKDLTSSNSTAIEPEVIHLNSALHKLVTINDTFLYTNGATMWRADHVFSKNISFRQFFIKNVKDFILCEDKIICTTFSKMIYTFSLEADDSYLKPETKEYSLAEDLLVNTEYLHKIFVEVEKSKELSKILSIEGSYIAAMSLARHQETMHKVIHASVTVCGSFEELMKENQDELTLTEEIYQYLDPSIYLFLVTAKMDCEVQGGLFDIVSDIMANSEVELQVTLSDEKGILKTTSVKVSNMNFLIPLHLENAVEINVILRLVARIPGTYDKKQKVWIELYRKDTKLSAEHFIRANFHKSLICLKRWTEDFEKSIMLCSNMNRNQFRFINTSKHSSYSHVMYVRLPQKLDSSNFRKYFSRIKSHFILEMLMTDEFIQSKGEIGFLVGKEVVALALENDGFSNPRLKVMSGSLKVTAGVRNFFTNIVYGENTCKPGEEFISLSFYTAVENLQKEIKDCVTTWASFEEFAPLQEKFEKEVIGMLPV